MATSTKNSLFLSQQRQRAQLTTAHTTVCKLCKHQICTSRFPHDVCPEEVWPAPGPAGYCPWVHSTLHTASPATSGPAHTKHSHFVHKYIVCKIHSYHNVKYMIVQQACLYAARLILTTQVHCVTAEHIMRCSKFCNK